ncbi:hypothetical protein DPMN_127408, partial [Dreissena polymorpha]
NPTAVSWRQSRHWRWYIDRCQSSRNVKTANPTAFAMEKITCPALLQRSVLQ